MEGMDLPISSRVGHSTASAGNRHASLQAGLGFFLDGLSRRLQSVTNDDVSTNSEALNASHDNNAR